MTEGHNVLLENWARGDGAAFERLFLRYYAQVLQVLHGVTGRLDECDMGDHTVDRYNTRMDIDAVRVACPACGSRLTVMPRVQYLACTHCGSEYLVQRRGQAVGLEPFDAEQFEISKQIAEVEKSQGEGCSNVFFWIFLVAGVFFCVIGYLGRTLFQNNNALLIAGWAVSLLALTLAAGVLLRTLNTQRAKRMKLEARQRELYAPQGEEGDLS